MSHLFISTGVGSVSCASWGVLWFSGHMWPHADVCTFRQGEIFTAEVSVKLDSLLSFTCNLFNGRHYMAFTSIRLCPLSDHLLSAFYVPGIVLCVAVMKNVRKVYNPAEETKMKPS